VKLQPAGWALTHFLTVSRAATSSRTRPALWTSSKLGAKYRLGFEVMTDQNPVVWGLNLYGPPRFCRNVRYGSDPTRPLREVIQAWPSVSDISIRSHYEELWQAYASVSGAWDARAFLRVIETVIAPLTEQPEALAAFFDRLGTAMPERAQGAADVFRPAQVGAALAVSLLPYIGQKTVARQARRLQIEIGDALIAAGNELADHLERERFALLGSSGGGLSDLFYLPLRIANILGWAGAAPQMFDADDPRHAEAETIFARLLRQVLQYYTCSVVAMSDAQAPCWAVALSRAAILGLTEEAERLAGLLYNSLIACKGACRRTS
jgi:hypothetical protein